MTISKPHPYLEGLTVHPDETGENLVIVFGDGVSNERLIVSALELAEGLSRLESEDGRTWRSDALEMHDMDLSERLSFAPDRLPYPTSERTGDYRIAEIALERPSGFLVMRRVMLAGPDTLEFDTPSGSVYNFDYASALHYLRPMLPR
jgi:hypothetical protein